MEMEQNSLILCVWFPIPTECYLFILCFHIEFNLIRWTFVNQQECNREQEQELTLTEDILSGTVSKRFERKRAAK